MSWSHLSSKETQSGRFIPWRSAAHQLFLIYYFIINLFFYLLLLFIFYIFHCGCLGTNWLKGVHQSTAFWAEIQTSAYCVLHLVASYRFTYFGGWDTPVLLWFRWILKGLVWDLGVAYWVINIVVWSFTVGYLSVRGFLWWWHGYFTLTKERAMSVASWVYEDNNLFDPRIIIL